jgi:hypothetical protein
LHDRERDCAHRDAARVGLIVVKARWIAGLMVSARAYL